MSNLVLRDGGMRTPPTRRSENLSTLVPPVIFPNRWRQVCHSRVSCYPQQMQEDRSRSCATSQHALICILMPPLVHMCACLYLVGVTRDVCLLK